MIHQFSEEGNSLGISYSLYRNRQDNDAYKTFSTTFYQLQDISGRDSTDLQHQYQDSPGQSGNHEIRADYTWRITKKNNLQSHTHGDSRMKRKCRVPTIYPVMYLF